MSKTWVCVALALIAGVLFLLAGFQEPAQTLKSSAFDVDIGLALVAFALAVSWAPA